MGDGFGEVTRLWWCAHDKEPVIRRSDYRKWQRRALSGGEEYPDFEVRYSDEHWGAKRGGRHSPMWVDVVTTEATTGFNFTKAKPAEVLCSVNTDGDVVPPDSAAAAQLLFNVSPMFLFHSLLVPAMDALRPQVLSASDLKFASNFISKMNTTNESGRMVYNSLGAFASVNHLHFHFLVLEDGTWPIENARTEACKDLEGVATVEGYPVRALHIDLLSKGAETLCAKALSTLHEGNIAYNLLISHTTVYIVPRKNQFSNTGDIRVAVVEVMGCPIASSQEQFTSMTKHDYTTCLQTEVSVENETFATLLASLY